MPSTREMLWERRIRVTDLESFSHQGFEVSPARAPWAETHARTAAVIGTAGSASPATSRRGLFWPVSRSEILLRRRALRGKTTKPGVGPEVSSIVKRRPVDPIDRIVEEHGVATGQYCGKKVRFVGDGNATADQEFAMDLDPDSTGAVPRRFGAMCPTAYGANRATHREFAVTQGCRRCGSS